MTEKFIFSMQIMSLGLSLVILVLFALYGLMVLFNRFFSRTPAKEEKPVTMKFNAEGLPPQLAAAISAAVSCYRAAHTGHVIHGRLREKRRNIDGSRWLAAARRDLMENREHLEIARRERT